MRGWSGWINLGGDLTSPAAAASSAPNHLEVFVRGQDNHLVWRRWDGSKWSGWINLGGDIEGAPAVAALAPNRLAVFARGIHDDDLVWRRWDGSKWSGWTNLGGDLSSSPAVALSAPNHLEVFVRGQDNHLVWRRWDGSKWSGWINLGGDIEGAPAVVTLAPNRLAVFARGFGGADLLWRRWDGSKWSGWTNIGGDPTSPPAVALSAPDHLEVFVRGRDNDLVWRRWDGSKWSGWINLGGDIEGAPAVASLGSSRLAVFVRGIHDDDLVWRRFPEGLGRWASIGPRLITGGTGSTRNWVGRLGVLAVHPQTPAVIYAGARGSGLWKTEDAGAHWRPLADQLPMMTVHGLAIDPSASSRLYVATPRGVFRSTDGGATWTARFTGDLNPRAADGGALLIDPGDPDRLYLTSADGVYRSTTAATSWDLVLSGGRAGSLAIDPSNNERLVAALKHADPSKTGIYQSDDAGDNWRKLTGCPGGRLPAVTEETGVKFALSGDRWYASFKSDEAWTIYRTTDIGCSIGGRTEREWKAGWSPTESIGDDPVRKRLWGYLYADPNDPDTVYAGGTDLWVSHDAGDSFTRSKDPHVDHHAFAVDPLKPKTTYTGTDGGLYRSSDRGRDGTWTFIAEGLLNVELYSLAGAATDPDLLIGGTQDNHIVRRIRDSTVWDRLSAGPVGDVECVVIDPSNHRTFYALNQYMDQMNRSTDGGTSWSAIEGLPKSCDIWAGEYPSRPVNHLIVHPTKPSVLLATCGSLWRGLPWQKSLTLAGSETVVRAAVDPSVDLYYAGSSNGAVHAGAGGTNWKRVFVHPGQDRVLGLTVDPDDPTLLYVAFESAGADRVYRLRRASSSPASMNGIPIGSNLPSGLTVYSIAVDRMIPRTIYAGTSGGVYSGLQSTVGNAWSWTPFATGLPPADVRTLEVSPLTGVMRAGTFGRGAFEVLTAAIRTKSSGLPPDIVLETAAASDDTEEGGD